MDDLILRAARLANHWHAGQLRKYRPQPYIIHPSRVAGRVMLLDDVTADEVAAAWLHDVIEDTPCTADLLLQSDMPRRTVELVVELTNPSKQASDLPRAARKQMDHEHLSGISHEGKRIKLLDRIDNLRDIKAAEQGFQSLFAAESVELAACLAAVDDELLEEFYCAIEELGFARDHQDPRTKVKP